eukprot:Awhi_evm1s7566
MSFGNFKNLIANFVPWSFSFNVGNSIPLHEIFPVGYVSDNFLRYFNISLSN